MLSTLLAVGAVPQLGHRVARELLAAVGLALIVWSVVTYSEALPFPGLNALLPCIGAALLIWLGGEEKTIVGRVLSSIPLVFIGLLLLPLRPVRVPNRNDLSVGMAANLSASRRWRYHQHRAGSCSQCLDLIQAMIFQMSSSVPMISP